MNIIKFLGASVFTAMMAFFGWSSSNAPAYPLQTSNPTTPTALSSSSDSEQGGHILLLVDSTLLSGLSAELQTYSQDVKKELGADTTIMPVTATDTVLTLKKEVTDFYAQNGLAGVLIIGNVPTAYFYNSAVDSSGTIFDSEGLQLSDSIYQDVFNACVYSSSAQAFDDKNTDCQTALTIPKYWVARLTPNSSTVSDLSLLKSYFARNHAFRTGQISFNKNLLVYLPLLSVIPDGTSSANYFNQSIQGYGTYSPSQYNDINYNDTNSDAEYLSAISTPEQYEAVIFNGHGLPTFHQKNIYSADVTNASFVFLDILSCSTGRFTTPDYLAGKYLFDGGLIDIGESTPSLTPTVYDRDMYEMLSEGVPFYKAFELLGIGVGSNIFGDPTLKMRYDVPTVSSGPDIVVSSTNDLTFSKSNPTQTFTITNKGTQPLLFDTQEKYLQQQNSSYLTSSSDSLDANTITADNKPDTLLPGKTTTVSIQSSYFFPYDTIPAGTYQGRFYVTSNDPANPLVEIGLNFVSTNTGDGSSTSTTPSPSVTVIYPNGGEVVNAAKGDGTLNIQWTTQNWGSLPLNIDMVNAGGTAYNLATNVPNTGSYIWTENANIPNGTYKIHMYTGQNTSTANSKGTQSSDEDYSDSYFTYYGPPVTVVSSTLSTYTDSQSGFSFQYPSDFALAANLTPAQQNLTSSYMGVCSATRGEGPGNYSNEVSLCYVGNETTDGFSASAVNVFSSTTANISDCQKIEQKGDAGGEYQQQTKQTVIGGITFYEDMLNDAGLGHYVDIDSFRTYHGGACYDIELDTESHVGSSPSWNGLSPDFVTMMNNKLESILSTFKFTN